MQITYIGIRHIRGWNQDVFSIQHAGETIKAESQYGTKYTIDLSRKGSPYTVGFLRLPRRPGKGFVTIQGQKFNLL